MPCLRTALHGKNLKAMLIYLIYHYSPQSASSSHCSVTHRFGDHFSGQTRTDHAVKTSPMKSATNPMNQVLAMTTRENKQQTLSHHANRSMNIRNTKNAYGAFYGQIQFFLITTLHKKHNIYRCLLHN